MHKRRLYLESLDFALIEQNIASITHMPRTDESRIIVKSIKEKYRESHEVRTLVKVPLNIY